MPGNLFRDVVSGRGVEYHDGSLFYSDAMDLLASIRDEVADIVFLDPPFNLGKKYGSSPAKDDSNPEQEYRHFLNGVLDESIRILKQGGALYLYHLPQWAMRMGPVLEERLVFRHWIAISMKNGFVGRNVLYPAHYALLYYTKGEPNVARRPKISPLTCRECEEYVKDYGGYRKKIEEEGGVSLSDVWEDLSPVRHPANKHRQANELTEEIPGRVLDVSAIEDGLLVDPFVGSGTSLVKAREAGMRFVGGDRDPESFDVTQGRLGAEKRKIECTSMS